VVQALVALEKQAKQENYTCAYGQLLGPWRLGFITGTQKARKRAGVVLGSGRFLPRWLQISLTYGEYCGEPMSSASASAPPDQGTVVNAVQVAGLHLALNGPTRLQQGRILAFDFTQMTLKLGGLQLYDGFIRGGQEREEQFPHQGLKDQAFFSYFWLDEGMVAARGRGGGLAMWVRPRHESLQ
jgi:hypothetical protein